MRTANVLALAALLAGCGGGGGSGGGPTGPNPPGGPAPSTATVAMLSSSFNPSQVTLARNGTVTWTNSSGENHNVTFNQVTGAPANVGDFANGSQSRSFGTAGSFPYQCTNHPGMNGTVTVQ